MHIPLAGFRRLVKTVPMTVQLRRVRADSCGNPASNGLKRQDERRPTARGTLTPPSKHPAAVLPHPPPPSQPWAPRGQPRLGRLAGGCPPKTPAFPHSCPTWPTCPTMSGAPQTSTNTLRVLSLLYILLFTFKIYRLDRLDRLDPRLARCGASGVRPVPPGRPVSVLTRVCFDTGGTTRPPRAGCADSGGCSPQLGALAPKRWGVVGGCSSSQFRRSGLGPGTRAQRRAHVELHLTDG